MFHAFIIKLFFFTHIKPSFYCHRKQSNNSGTSRHTWSPSGLQISVLSHGRVRPTCQYAELNSSLTVWHVSVTVSGRHSSSSSSSSFSSLYSPKLSGNEVGLRDDALHFVICRVCRCLIVADRHFMSVSLKRTKRKTGLLPARTRVHSYTCLLC